MVDIVVASVPCHAKSRQQLCMMPHHTGIPKTRISKCDQDQTLNATDRQPPMKKVWSTSKLGSRRQLLSFNTLYEVYAFECIYAPL